MNRAWLIVLTGLVIFSMSAWAQPTVTIDNGPFFLNPSNDLDVDFTLLDNTFVYLGDQYTFNFYLSSDTTLDGGDALQYTTSPFLLGCDESDINTTGMNCSATYSTGAQTGMMYVILEASKNSSGTITAVSTNSPITFDSTNPSITGPTFNPLVTSGVWSNTPTTMTATCTDATTCVLEYKVGTGNFTALPQAGVAFSNENNSIIIRATDAAGNTALSTAFDLKVDTTIPTGTFTLNAGAVPAHLGTTDTTPTIEVTLSDGSNGSGLNLASVVFKQNGAVVTPTQNGNSFSYTPPSALADGTYTFTVDVSDTVGNTANLSQVIKVDTTGPTNVTASATTPTNASTPVFTISATDAGVGNNLVVFQCASNTPEEIAYSTSINTFNIVTKCPSGDGPRTINVKVKDALGNISAQGVDVVILYDSTSPTAPGNFTNTDREDTSASFSWSLSTDNGGSGVSQYRLYRSTSSTQPSNASKTINHPSTSTTDTGLSSCTSYNYWIEAVDGVGLESNPTGPINVTTTGCNNSGGNNNNNGGGSGGGGGGGGGGSCNVSFTIPASIYAGEKITATAEGNSYVNGYFRATPAGKATVSIQKIGTAATKWTGPFDVPNSIGTSVKFVFGTDSCTASTSRVIKDPSTKPAATAPAPTNTPTDTGGNNTSNTVLENEPVLPEPVLLNVGMEQLATLLSAAGFNADNAQLVSDAEKAITEWNAQPFAKIVPVEGEKGKYALQYALSLKNTGNKGSVKIVMDIPKSFAKTAGDFTSNVSMTVLKDDPLVQFEVSELFEGQTIDIVLTSTNTYTLGVAQSKVEALQALIVNPPILFSSGVAKAVANKEAGQPLFDGGNLMTGLVGFVGNVGPLVLGFLLIVGLIFVSIRVVKGSVEGADNPILRSSIGVRNTGPVHRTSTPVRGSKMWKSDSSSRIGRY